MNLIFKHIDFNISGKILFYSFIRLETVHFTNLDKYYVTINVTIIMSSYLKYFTY